MTRVGRFTSLWLPVVAYGGLVFYLSSLPQAAAAGSIPDYVSHSLEYLGLTVLLIRALNRGLGRPMTAGVRVSAVGLAILYAISDEIHQLWVLHRTASVKDVLSDALGAVLAIGAAAAIHRLRLLRTSRWLEVTLVTRSECHLCQEARAVLTGLSRELPLRISEVDVATDPSLERRFGEQVPVILAGGRKVSKLVPDPAAIRRRLARMVPRTG